MAVFQILQGLETLPLRMRAHAENAALVARFLASRPEASGLKTEGGIVAFDLPDAQKVIGALALFRREAEPGDLRSSAAVSANGRILLSVGVEHADDLLADLAAALNKKKEAP